MRKNKGEATATFVLFCCVLLIFLLFASILSFQFIYSGIFHNVRNDMYLINRNVLLSLEREKMGLDKYACHDEIEERVKEEARKLWNADVSNTSESGLIRNFEVLEAKAFEEDAQIEIYTKLNISVKNLMFSGIVGNISKFDVSQRTRISKMKGFNK